MGTGPAARLHFLHLHHHLHHHRLEQSLVNVQKNEKELQELRISYQQHTLDIVGMNNRTRIDGMLKARDSQLHAPQDPPQRIILEK